MKLEGLLSELERIKLRAEDANENLDSDLVTKVILQLLLDYINNPKVEEAVNEIPF